MTSTRAAAASRAARPETRRPAPPSRADRAALIAFVAVIVTAIPLILYLGRDQWFFLDEYDFLSDRSFSLHDLLRPHNEHWSTLPIVLYRVLYKLFGLRTYVPYQLAVLLLHLALAVLLRHMMIRRRVNPWIATVVAGAFVLLGSGRQDIVWGFQVGYVGALLLGLCQLDLADHDGGWSRRDWAALVCGVLALL